MQFQRPEWHDSLPSTNSWVMERLQRGDSVPNGHVVAAREQTAGRGRRGRLWAAAPGRDLTFSAVIRTSAPPLQALSVPMAAALGVFGTLTDYDLSPRTKWPNDVLVGGAKICGILAERSGDALVVGIGVNVNMSASVAASIDRPVTSIHMETGAHYDVGAVLDHVLEHLARWVTVWEGGGFAALRADWIRRCAYLHQHVSVGDDQRQATGRLVGFGESGQALLAQADDTVIEAWAGDLVRPWSQI
jgi:BirA family transcriptional regulator, biotin operon repressor / biotin---[acetyl-CoA-carboxylase] ligase